MPQTHNHRTGRFSISVRSNPRWRKYVPYFVGQRVEFNLDITDHTPQEGGRLFYIWESFGGKSSTRRGPINALLQNVLEGDIISQEGDVVYKLGIGMGQHVDEADGLTIFTAKAINTDRWSLGCIGFFLGILSAIIAGIILNMLEIDKFWHIINPAW